MATSSSDDIARAARESDARVREQMENMGIDIEQLNGEPLHPKIPRSRMYSARMRKQIVHDMGNHMFHLIEDIPYPHERIACSNGRDECMHCGRSITGRIFFVPYEMTENDFKNHNGHVGPVYVCFPDPYCRAECALASLPDNFRGKAEFFMMYGPDVQVSPPRSCLFGMGKISLDEFHRRIDNEVVWTRDEACVHFVLAPIYYSSIPGKARQITEDAKAISDCMTHFTARDIDDGESRSNVYTIPPRGEKEAQMGSVFKVI